MAVEMNKSASVRLTPVQEIKLAKPATELYVGQVLKTVVVTALTNDQVLININGQNLNAKSSHHFTPGELLEVKVIANQNETILEVQQKDSGISVLQSALLQALPRQAPPTQLLQTMAYLMQENNLSPAVNQQIKAILNNLTSLPQLSQQLAQAISQSGVFLESVFLNWQGSSLQQKLKTDFKGQCFKLLNSLPKPSNPGLCLSPESKAKQPGQDPLPLAGAIPQPLHKDSLLALLGQSPESLQNILREQITQALARITAHQINHLTHDNKEGYLLMLDLPIKTTPENIDVIPLMIKQHKAEPMQPSKWSMSFALSLPRLGDLQATISLNAKNIDVKINTEQAITMHTLNECQKEMSDVLANLGLQLRDWKLQTGLEDNHIDVANLNLLDIRI